VAGRAGGPERARSGSPMSETATSFELPRRAIEEVCGAMSDGQAELLGTYGRAVIDGSRRANLVSRRDLERLGEHFIDSAALLAAVVPLGASLADLGSGGGFPGVVAAILRPEVEVTLVEARQRKAVFLKRVVRSLELTSVSVLHARLEALAGEVSFELATARALGNVEKVLEPALGVIAEGGRLVLFKGPRWRDERDRAVAIGRRCGGELVRETDVELPGLDRTTTFAEFHVERSISSG